MNTVSVVGVDVNEAVQFPHKSYTLQFVPGFGPRKAKALLNSISQSVSFFLFLFFFLFDKYSVFRVHYTFVNR